MVPLLLLHFSLSLAELQQPVTMQPFYQHPFFVLLCFDSPWLGKLFWVILTGGTLTWWERSLTPNISIKTDKIQSWQTQPKDVRYRQGKNIASEFLLAKNGLYLHIFRDGIIFVDLNELLHKMQWFFEELKKIFLLALYFPITQSVVNSCSHT